MKPAAERNWAALRASAAWWFRGNRALPSCRCLPPPRSTWPGIRSSSEPSIRGTPLGAVGTREWGARRRSQAPKRQSACTQMWPPEPSAPQAPPGVHRCLGSERSDGYKCPPTSGCPRRGSPSGPAQGLPCARVRVSVSTNFSSARLAGGRLADQSPWSRLAFIGSTSARLATLAPLEPPSR